MSEPVAWLYEDESGSKELVLDCNGEYARRLMENGYAETPLYASPPTTPAVESESGESERAKIVAWLRSTHRSDEDHCGFLADAIERLGHH